MKTLRDTVISEGQVCRSVRLRIRDMGPSVATGRDGVFTQEQLTAILSALPDPAFILTRSGRYAAVFGGKDNSLYNDCSGIVGL